MRRRLLAVLLLVVVIAALVVTVRWVFGRPEVGPPVALCPGPDAYGYTCQTGATLSYVDATQDAGLYLDDGGVTLDLPFSFTLYGSVFQQVYASSNGNLQFSGQNPGFNNVCLDGGPSAGFGAMIAPYWDDLDLTFTGLLETEVVGSAPERVFVIEWDAVASFASPEETVTFEVQFFEGSNNIAFLYEDVSRSDANQGSSATIGLQSEGQGYALQYACNQFAVQNGSSILFLHPESQTDQTAAPDLLVRERESAPDAAKGDVAMLVDYLNRHGPASLPEARAQWLNRMPQRDSQWQWADTNGDGGDELVLLWRPPGRYAFQSQLVIVQENADGSWQPLWTGWPLARQEEKAAPVLRESGDVTGDGAADVLLTLPASGRLVVVSRMGDAWAFHGVPGQCQGSIVLREVSGDGVLDIVRDGCGEPGRQISSWNGVYFK